MIPRASEAGFTLIEVLVSIFALALLMSTGGVMLNSVIAGQKAVDGRLEGLHEIQIVRAHLSSDIGNAVKRGARLRNLENERQSFFGGQRKRNGAILGLVRSGWGYIDNEEARSDLVIVEYIFQQNALSRRVWLRPDRARNTPSFEETILTGVQDIDVSFSVAGEPANVWEYFEVDGQPILPDTVTLNILLEGGLSSEQKFLVGRRS